MSVPRFPRPSHCPRTGHDGHMQARTQDLPTRGLNSDGSFLKWAHKTMDLNMLQLLSELQKLGPLGPMLFFASAAVGAHLAIDRSSSPRPAVTW